MTNGLYPVPKERTKLDDCLEHLPKVQAELFIVEGDSAALSAARMRNPQFQAVLPMQGKPLNTWKAKPEKVAANPLFEELAKALQREAFAKIALLMDPDADGIHCSALMMMYFLKYHPALLAQGRLLLMQAPMAEITDHDTGELIFAYGEKQFMALARQYKGKPSTVVRYRGLANMSPEVLRSQCIDPSTRRAMTLTENDAKAALEVFGG